jgi:hypothetical protein
VALEFTTSSEYHAPAILKMSFAYWKKGYWPPSLFLVLLPPLSEHSSLLPL